ncbi:MAG TPA: AraC family transcriptional regulator [Candidatus Blautia faecipullorum]|mgnify:CR=1 FL=1|nr:AraC family transcriptional regulator [Candidatus Blautia faecipullorum]
MSDTLFTFFPDQYFIDLCLYQSGYEQCKPLHSGGLYVHNHYLFHYVISGSGTLLAVNQSGEEKRFHIRSGQGFLIFPGQAANYHADQEHPWEYTWIEFDGARVNEILMNCGLSIANPVYHSIDKRISNELKDTMLDMALSKEKYTTFRLISQLYKCADCLIRSSRTIPLVSGERLADSYVKEATHFIEQNFHNNITVEDIAAFCNISRGYLSKLMKRHNGLSPQELLFQYRMAKASQLLQLTSMTVKDVGKAVGYPDQLRFSRAFRKAFGIPPSQWRKQNLPRNNIAQNQQN